MITPFILVGGWIFWLLVNLFVVALLISDSDDNNSAWSGFVVAAVFVGILTLFSNATLPDLSLTHILIFAASYIAAGCSWTIISWVYLLKRIKAFIATQGLEPAVAYKNRYGFSAFPPRPADFKARISRWLIWWPVSVLNYLFSGILTDIFEAVYNLLAGFLDRISKRMFE